MEDPMSNFPFHLLAIAIFLLISCASSSNGQSAPNLIALVPSGTGMVAGIEALKRDSNRPDLFIPLPGKSLRDYDYFNSLCGADPAKSVQEVIFVDDHLELNEYSHTLLARGHFNSQILYRSATSLGAVYESYRGLSVLRVSPLARERSKFNEYAWLAIVDSRVLLLGTPEYVRQEIDRLLGGSAADPSLERQFEAVKRSDVWWIILKPQDASTVLGALMTLSPTLAHLLNNSSVRVGTRYGRQVEFEYQVAVSEATRGDSQAINDSREGPQRGQFAIVSGEVSQSRGVIKIPRARYQQWISEIAAGPRSYR
jgi:hypothetical protein